MHAQIFNSIKNLITETWTNEPYFTFLERRKTSNKIIDVLNRTKTLKVFKIGKLITEEVKKFLNAHVETIQNLNAYAESTRPYMHIYSITSSNKNLKTSISLSIQKIMQIRKNYINKKNNDFYLDKNSFKRSMDQQNSQSLLRKPRIRANSNTGMNLRSNEPVLLEQRHTSNNKTPPPPKVYGHNLREDNNTATILSKMSNEELLDLSYFYEKEIDTNEIYITRPQRLF